jgi:lysophospholipase L1-like esterase
MWRAPLPPSPSARPRATPARLLRHGALALCALALCGALTGPKSAHAQTPPHYRILIASDSTALKYGGQDYPQMGWGMVLPCSLRDNVEVVNRARGGESSKSYIATGQWKGLMDQLKAGDTVLIQFGHNDADRSRADAFTEPGGEYRQNLIRMVADVRARGATPVLVTPVATADFLLGQIRNTHQNYAEAMRAVARQTHAALVDLNADSTRALQARGERAAQSLYLVYAKGDQGGRFADGSHDTTHLNEGGARLAAALVATRLQRLRLPVSAFVQPATTGDQPRFGGPSCSKP